MDYIRLIKKFERQIKRMAKVKDIRYVETLPGDSKAICCLTFEGKDKILWVNNGLYAKS